MISPILLLLQNVTSDFYTITKTLLVEYVTDVILYRANADLEFRGDFLVTQPRETARATRFSASVSASSRKLTGDSSIFAELTSRAI